MEEIKEEYIKPLTSVLYIGDIMQQNFPISNRQGTGGPMAKPGDDEWEEEDESMTNKWDNLVPSGVPESWQLVGE